MVFFRSFAVPSSPIRIRSSSVETDKSSDRFVVVGRTPGWAPRVPALADSAQDSACRPKSEGIERMNFDIMWSGVAPLSRDFIFLSPYTSGERRGTRTSRGTDREQDEKRDIHVPLHTHTHTPSLSPIGNVNLKRVRLVSTRKCGCCPWMKELRVFGEHRGYPKTFLLGWGWRDNLRKERRLFF